MSIRSSLFPSNALRKHARFAATIGALALVSACASDQPGVSGPSSRVGAASEGVPFNEGLVSPVWQQKARDLVAGANFSPLAAGRAYPLLGVAQYLAVQRAEAAVDVSDAADDSGNGIGSGGRQRLETDRGAVAGASRGRRRDGCAWACRWVFQSEHGRRTSGAWFLDKQHGAAHAHRRWTASGNDPLVPYFGKSVSSRAAANVRRRGLQHGARRDPTFQ